MTTDHHPIDDALRSDRPILVVEDDPNFAKITRKRLEMNGFKVLCAEDGQQGLELCLEHQPDIVLSDWMMPKMDGVELCQAIRRDQRTHHTYVILISNKADTGERVRGFDAGADDYLVKSCDPEELYARLRAGLRIRTLQRELQRQAWIDGMTRLYNRAFFYERVEAELGRAVRYLDPLTVAMIDLDNFKTINDTRGHLAGDAAILYAAQSIQGSCRDSDIVCRYGGDEYAVLFVNADTDHSRSVLERIRQGFKTRPFIWDGEVLEFGLSYGLAQANHDNPQAPDAFIGQADAALYEMKRDHKVPTAR